VAGDGGEVAEVLREFDADDGAWRSRSLRDDNQKGKGNSLNAKGAKEEREGRS
jgi:hypothetical protein